MIYNAEQIEGLNDYRREGGQLVVFFLKNLQRIEEKILHSKIFFVVRVDGLSVEI